MPRELVAIAYVDLQLGRPGRYHRVVPNKERVRAS